MHTGAWDESVDLTGKRVAVIGSAASGVQSIPEIAKAAGQLTVFQRSANWVLPKEDVEHTPEQLDQFHTDPDVLQEYHNGIMAFVGPSTPFSNPTINGAAEWVAAVAIEEVEDPGGAQAKLTPTTPWGCMRPLFSNHYYPTFNRPNVELVTDAIERITPTGIVTADGVERELDVIVFATGYVVDKFASRIPITGRGGLTLDEAWADGAQAHLGITTSGFPNLFMLYGPNTNQGSLIPMIEYEAQYAVKTIQAMDAAGIDWVDVKPEVMDAYNTELQAALDRRRGVEGRVQPLLPERVGPDGDAVPVVDVRLPRSRLGTQARRVRRRHPLTRRPRSLSNSLNSEVPMNAEQLEKMGSGKGFIAALDQSGGSTPKALKLVRRRRGAVLRRRRDVRRSCTPCAPGSSPAPASTATASSGRSCSRTPWTARSRARPTADYLWDVKQVVPILKVDKGLADEADGAQVMKPIPGLDELLARAVAKGVFGTKMRSVIKQADATGVDAVVRQQFEIGRQILDAGLVPIIEPEVDIHCPDKAEAEALLRSAIKGQLDELRRRPAGDAEADPARGGRLLRAAGGALQRAAGRGPVRRLLPRGVRRAADPPARRGRQLLPCADRGSDLPAERRRVRRRARLGHRQHLRRLDHLSAG